MRFAIRSTIVLMTLASFIVASGCAMPDEESEEESEPVASIEEPLSGCVVASSIAALATGVAVGATKTTGVCVGGTLVTTGGTAMPICIVPAAGATSAAVAAVVSGGIAYLACSTVTATQIRRQRPCTGSKDTWERRDWVAECTLDNGATMCTSTIHPPCRGTHTHGFRQKEIPDGAGGCKWVNDNKLVRCEGPREKLGSCRAAGLNGRVVQCGGPGSQDWGIVVGR